MTKFEALIAAAKANHVKNCNASKNDLAGGWAEDGAFAVIVTPVQGRISHLRTTKITCYANGKRISKEELQKAMG